MNFRTTAPLQSIAPSFRNTVADSPGSDSPPVYVRSSGITSHLDNITNANFKSRATDGAGASSHWTAHSLSHLKKKCSLAAEALESLMKPGHVIDLGRLSPGGAPGYLCRMTATGDGYVVQTHEQAKTAPFSGLFFPTVNNPHGNIAMDMTPVTDVNQVPPQMYNMLHSLARFTTRHPIEQLLMKA